MIVGRKREEKIYVWIKKCLYSKIFPGGKKRFHFQSMTQRGFSHILYVSCKMSRVKADKKVCSHTRAHLPYFSFRSYTTFLVYRVLFLEFLRFHLYKDIMAKISKNKSKQEQN